MNRERAYGIGFVAAVLIASGCTSIVKGPAESTGVPSAAGTQEAKDLKDDFEAGAVGNAPTGWSLARTGDGEGSDWKIAEDNTAPKGSKVLAQTGESPRPTFNLCVADNTGFRDVEVSVAFKAVRGKMDQGGGVVWRYQDHNNYYVVRFNPLEDNYRLYKVVDGKRSQLASKEELKAPAGNWHTLLVRMNGDEIVCLLDGTKHLEAKDGMFSKAGKVGLWTKADAQTCFDDFQARELTRR